MKKKRYVVTVILALLLFVISECADGKALSGGCASSIWMDENQVVHGPYVSCEPYSYVLPELQRD